MTTASRQPAPDGSPAHYAKGWAVNAGGVPGTSSLLVRTADEFTWAAVTNSTNAQPDRDLDLDALMWRLVTSVKSWPDS